MWEGDANNHDDGPPIEGNIRADTRRRPEDLILNIKSGEYNHDNGPPVEGNIRGEQLDRDYLTQKWSEILRAGQRFDRGEISN